MVYPTFAKKFSQKFDLLQKKSPEAAENALRIKTERDCKTYGVDCHVAMNIVSDMIQKLYRVFSILNKDISEPFQHSTSNGGSRDMGTLLANLHFQFDGDQDDIASLQLEQDLIRVLRNIIPNGEISLTDMIGFLGYSNVLGDMSKRTYKTIEDNCDLNKYMLRWNSYFELLFQSTNIRSSNCDTGNFIELHLFTKSLPEIA